ncbi:MAG: DUF3465 domain-containing protein [Pseudomonadota bacterium]|nr:DUF3465 domain-containing protein [Pseudomonadota bacterium]
MKRLGQVVLVAVLAVVGWRQFADRPLAGAGEPEEGTEASVELAAAPMAGGGTDAAQEAFDQRASGRMLRVSGRVVRTLADDRDGSPHQRFILATDTGQTLLVAHNLDLAPRLEGLKAGEEVSLYGEYEWNDQGGIMHWTHDDPAGRHVAGYIEWRGRKYQ